MKKSFLLLAAICAIPFMSCNNDEETDGNEENQGGDKKPAVLCPFALGNTWTYNYVTKKGESMTITQTFEKSYTIDGKTGYSYDELEDEQNCALRNSDSEGSIIEYHFKNGKFVEQSVLYKINAKVGEKYTAKAGVYSEDGFEIEEMEMTCVKKGVSVTVPAGTFNCYCFCMTVYDRGELSDKFYEYYAENVGLVQHVRYEFPSSNKNDSVMMGKYTLSSYKLN